MTPESSTVDRSRRLRNRLVVSAFGAAALVFLVGPFVVRWYGTRDICRDVVVTAKDRDRASGTDWEVSKSDCGPPVGIVWQLRIIPTKGISSLAYEARDGGQEPVGYEQKGFAGTIRLAGPVGDATTVNIELDPRGRPVAPVKFVAGKRVE